MIRSVRGLVIAGLLTLLVGLVVMFPARVAIKWFAPGDFSANAIHGTIWRGNATQIGIGDIYIRDIQWHFQPMPLFTGKLSYRIEGTLSSGFFESDFKLGMGGSIHLTDVKAALPLALFAKATGTEGLAGNITVNFDRVRISDGLPTAAEGILTIANLIVPDLGNESLGGYKAEFSSQSEAVVASVEDTDNVLDLAGSLRINSDRSYEFVAQLIATPNTPQTLRTKLRFLPPANSRGQQELREEGIL